MVSFNGELYETIWTGFELSSSSSNSAQSIVSSTKPVCHHHHHHHHHHNYHHHHHHHHHHCIHRAPHRHWNHYTTSFVLKRVLPCRKYLSVIDGIDDYRPTSVTSIQAPIKHTVCLASSLLTVIVEARYPDLRSKGFRSSDLDLKVYLMVVVLL